MGIIGRWLYGNTLGCSYQTQGKLDILLALLKFSAVFVLWDNGQIMIPTSFDTSQNLDNVMENILGK